MIIQLATTHMTRAIALFEDIATTSLLSRDVGNHPGY